MNENNKDFTSLIVKFFGFLVLAFGWIVDSVSGKESSEVILHPKVEWHFPEHPKIMAAKSYSPCADQQGAIYESASVSP